VFFLRQLGIVIRITRNSAVANFVDVGVGLVFCLRESGGRMETAGCERNANNEKGQAWTMAGHFAFFTGIKESGRPEGRPFYVQISMVKTRVNYSADRDAA
jgi:hypothetical protein